jgi:hypothetical protein
MLARRYSLVVVVALLLSVGGYADGQEAKAKKSKIKAKSAEVETVDAFGRPEGSIVDQTARYYVWYDGEKWHLRTTAKQARNFNGTIRITDGAIKSSLPVGLKKDRQKKSTSDAWRISDDRRELRFAFRTATLSDGLEIVVEGDGQIEFDLLIDTQRNPRAVFLGKKGEHPSQNPFRLPIQVARTGK